MKGVEQFNTQIGEVISIANFVYELKDLKTLVPKIQGMQTLENGFLQYHFGWKPLISDLKSLSKIVKDTIDRLEHLRRTNNMWNKVSYTGFLQPSDYPSVVPNAGPLSFPYISPIQTELVNYVGRFRVNARIKRTLTGLDGDIGMLKAFLAALGLNNPAKIVWNAIPYSFVVDWFVRVSDHFDGFQVYGGGIETKNVSWSLHETGSIRLYGNASVNGSPAQVTAGTIAFDRYQRGPGLPFTVGSISFSSLTTTQQMLGAALISQGLRR